MLSAVYRHTAGSIRDSIRIRIVTPDSIRIRFERKRPIRRSYQKRRLKRQGHDPTILEAPYLGNRAR